jgi:hypothetical protein
VEVSIRRLDPTCDGIGAVHVVEAVQRGQRVCKGDFEDRATCARGTAAVLSPARVGRAVDVSAGRLVSQTNKRSAGLCADASTDSKGKVCLFLILGKILRRTSEHFAQTPDPFPNFSFFHTGIAQQDSRPRRLCQEIPGHPVNADSTPAGGSNQCGLGHAVPWP